MDPRDNLLNIFPKEIRAAMEKARLDYQKLQEIRLRANAPVYLLYGEKEWILGRDGRLLAKEGQGQMVISPRQLKETAEYMASYSLYAAEDELRQGFITIQGGHRIGVAGRIVADRQQIRLIKFISFINVRVAHEVKGCADPVMDYLYEQESGTWRFLNTLIISPPRHGKTTLLRDIIRQVSYGRGKYPPMNVGVVDERSELGACYQGVPQNDLGPRTDVLDCCPKAQGMMMLVRSMSPQVVAADEIGSSQEAQAVNYITSCGCALAATVHGDSLEDVLRKPYFAQMAQEGMIRRFILLHRGLKGQKGRILDGGGTCIGSWEQAGEGG